MGRKATSVEEIGIIMDGLKTLPKGKKGTEEGLDALRESAHKFYTQSKPKEKCKKAQSVSMKNLMG